MSRDLALYGVHAAFWGAFGLARVLFGAKKPEGASDAPKAGGSATAPYSRVLVGLHMIAFGVMYFGIGQAVFGRQVPELFPFQRLAGTAVIAVGAVLASWALTFFHSWRIRAQIEAGHELATGGPFAYVRHPIYAALNLLSLGTLLWIPSGIEAVGLAFMVIGSDLRARAEEKVLIEAFGERYRAYMAASNRFIPGVY